MVISSLPEKVNKDIEKMNFNEKIHQPP